MSGTLLGIGLGPGDPELMTLKAHRLIAGTGVVAYPAPTGGESFARRIAADAIAEGAREIAIEVPMRPDPTLAQTAYDDAAVAIAAELDAGRDIALLCAGDPFFYGSFMYIFGRLAHRYATEVVPGVSSLGAVTAAARHPLCARDEVLTVLPATLPDADLADQLSRPGAVAVMKLGRHFARVRALIERLGRGRRALFVAHASLPDAAVHPLAAAPDTAPYFSMIVIPGEAADG